MYTASSSLLAMILSVIIALSGAGAASAVPETAAQTTFRDITVNLNDETYSIAAQPYFTYAIGAEMAAGTFGVQLGDDTLLTMQAAIDKDRIRLSVGGSGRVYTLTNETIAEAMDVDPDDLQMVEDLISSIAEMADCDMADTLKMNRDSYAALKQALPAGESTGSVQLGGKAIDTETYSGTLDDQTLAALLDALMNGENQPLANYVKQLLDFSNRIENTQYESWSEATADTTEDANDDPLPSLTYETAETGDDTYDCITVHRDGDDETQAIDYVFEYTLEDGDYRSSIEMRLGDDQDRLSLSGTMDVENALTDAPSAEFDFTYNISSEWAYPDEESPEESCAYNSNIEITLFGDARTENGLDSLNADLTVDNAYEHRTGAELENIDSSDSHYWNIMLSVCDSAAENEGVDTTVALAMDLDGETMGLSFIANQTDIPFDADALFANGKEMALTNAEGNLDTAMLGLDFMALAGDVNALLTQDTGLADMISAFSDFLCLDYYDEDYDDSNWADSYYEYLTADEVLARFAGTKYTIDAPEGYEVDEDFTYISRGNTYAAIGYQTVDGSDYITLYLNQTDDTRKYVVLNDDDASTLIDGTVVTLNGWGDDTYYNAILHRDDVDIFLTFSSMTLEEVQSLLSTLHAAE